ncbi:hypothetical protein IWQ60_003604 [Tieghemiomyces parasiticus]|uniref:Uncharacterized protein n=1 Tax=Tieghemiomyces parasiticus TaxID=78921 RepID=A0A9W8AHL2_9FUNG|nr:hypothetical protein IWQ60_003604 [Tieghemiomyces parasiticus]
MESTTRKKKRPNRASPAKPPKDAAHGLPPFPNHWSVDDVFTWFNRRKKGFAANIMRQLALDGFALSKLRSNTDLNLKYGNMKRPIRECLISAARQFRTYQRTCKPTGAAESATTPPPAPAAIISSSWSPTATAASSPSLRSDPIATVTAPSSPGPPASPMSVDGGAGLDPTSSGLAEPWWDLESLVHDNSAVNSLPPLPPLGSPLEDADTFDFDDVMLPALQVEPPAPSVQSPPLPAPQASSGFYVAPPPTLPTTKAGGPPSSPPRSPLAVARPLVKHRSHSSSQLPPPVLPTPPAWLPPTSVALADIFFRDSRGQRRFVSTPAYPLGNAPIDQTGRCDFWFWRPLRKNRRTQRGGSPPLDTYPGFKLKVQAQMRRILGSRRVVHRFPTQTIYQPLPGADAPVFIVDQRGRTLARFREAQPGVTRNFASTLTDVVNLCYSDSGESLSSESSDVTSDLDLMDADLDGSPLLAPPPGPNSPGFTPAGVPAGFRVHRATEALPLSTAVDGVAFDDDGIRVDPTDPILPLYGESDYASEDLAPSDYEPDPVITPAIRSPVSARPLRIMAMDVINRGIEAFEEEQRQLWQTSKLKDLALRAWRLWRLQQKRLDSLKASLAHVRDDRLPKLRDTIRRSGVTTEVELRRRCSALTESVHLCCELEWKVALVQGPCPEPPLPTDTSKQRTAIAVAAKSVDVVAHTHPPPETAAGCDVPAKLDDHGIDADEGGAYSDDDDDFIDDAELSDSDLQRYSAYYDADRRGPNLPSLTLGGERLATTEKARTTQRMARRRSRRRVVSDAPEDPPRPATASLVAPIPLAQLTSEPPTSSEKIPVRSPSPTVLPSSSLAETPSLATPDNNQHSSEPVSGSDLGLPQNSAVNQSRDPPQELSDATASMVTPGPVPTQPSASTVPEDTYFAAAKVVGSSPFNAPGATLKKTAPPESKDRSPPPEAVSYITLSDSDDGAITGSKRRLSIPDPSRTTRAHRDKRAASTTPGHSPSPHQRRRKTRSRRSSDMSLSLSDNVPGPGDLDLAVPRPPAAVQPPTPAIESAAQPDGSRAKRFSVKALVHEHSLSSFTQYMCDMLQQENVPGPGTSAVVSETDEDEDTAARSRLLPVFQALTDFRVADSHRPTLPFRQLVNEFYRAHRPGHVDLVDAAVPTKVITAVDSSDSERSDAEPSSSQPGPRPRGRRNLRPIMEEAPEVRELRLANRREELEYQRRLRKANQAAATDGKSPPASQASVLSSQETSASGRTAAAQSLVNIPAIVVNLGHPEDEADVLLAPFLAKVIKQHQIEGVRFMWKNLVMFSNHGCILAHEMGLGKTIQVVATVFTILREVRQGNPAIPAQFASRCVLVLCPPTLISNWYEEFRRWIPARVGREVLGGLYPFQLTGKAVGERLDILKRWRATGGVLIMGYQGFRTLAQCGTGGGGVGGRVAVNPEEARQFHELLIDPGPALVIADEGHELKNSAAKISIVAKQLKTRSRVCLSGYPLQNRLDEYWCMVDFVYPGILGTLPHFRNHFANPIDNGLYPDSTALDLRLSRIKLFVLQSVLRDFVQRREIAVMFADLPPKREFVITCKLTDLQWELYKDLLETHFHDSVGNSATGDGVRRSMLDKEMILRSICNHPHVCDLLLQKRNSGAAARSTLTTAAAAMSLARLNNPAPDDDSVMDAATMETAVPENLQSIRPVVNPLLSRRLRTVADPTSIEHSYKMQVLMAIVTGCAARGDKVLIFSRCLNTLDYLEILFKSTRIPQYHRRQKSNPTGPVQYFRLDGSIPVVQRQPMVDDFNHRPELTAFLISIKAGSLGLNVTSATRVILVDVGWNPSHDEQAVARAYRYGQTKPVFVYRLSTCGTMEDKIYNNNVHKVGLAKRVVDELPIEEMFTKAQLKSYFDVPPNDPPSLLPIKKHLLPLDRDPGLKLIVDTLQESVVDINERSFYEKQEEMTEEHLKEAQDELKKELGRISGEPSTEATEENPAAEIVTIEDEIPQPPSLQVPSADLPSFMGDSLQGLM